MKTSEFKKLIKESVREAIKEELKDILLEAIKSPKQTVVKEVIKENKATENHVDLAEQRKKYLDIINKTARGEDTISFNTSDLVNQGPIHVDNENGALPGMDIPMDMIANLLNPKH